MCTYIWRTYMHMYAHTQLCSAIWIDELWEFYVSFLVLPHAIDWLQRLQKRLCLSMCKCLLLLDSCIGSSSSFYLVVLCQLLCFYFKANNYVLVMNVQYCRMLKEFLVMYNHIAERLKLQKPTGFFVTFWTGCLNQECYSVYQSALMLVWYR
jgi:hypothetical protein